MSISVSSSPTTLFAPNSPNSPNSINSPRLTMNMGKTSYSTIHVPRKRLSTIVGSPSEESQAEIIQRRRQTLNTDTANAWIKQLSDSNKSSGWVSTMSNKSSSKSLRLAKDLNNLPFLNETGISRSNRNNHALKQLNLLNSESNLNNVTLSQVKDQILKTLEQRFHHGYSVTTAGPCITVILSNENSKNQNHIQEIKDVSLSLMNDAYNRMTLDSK
jgi:hypothetical protein